MADHSSKTTTDHNTIKQWVESRDGTPATVKETTDDGGPGILRIHFPDYGEQDGLETIDWETFFKAFENNRLAFVYQDELESGDQSRFCKLVDRT